MEVVTKYGPTGLVLLMLGALGVYGHHTGWTLPKRAELAPESSKVKEDWCDAHNVPDSRCIACHPELGGADAKDWCKEHGVPESKCTVCHPEVLTKGVAADWCNEHGVPESGCTLCHSEIAVRGEAPAPVVSVGLTSQPSGGKNARDPRTCQVHAARVQFASPESMRKVGLKLEKVQERPMIARIEANGEAGYDQTRVARIATRAGGIVRDVFKAVGDKVKAGELLAVVDASEVGREKAELLSALAQVDLRSKTLARIKDSAASGLRTKAELQEAESAVREARVRLFNAHQALINFGIICDVNELSTLGEQELAERVRVLGLREAGLESFPRSLSANLLPIAAPLEGVIASREVVPGEVVDTTRTLFTVADTTRMWVTADVKLEDARLLGIGQRLVFRPDGDPDAGTVGNVTWIGTAVDEKTRTVRVRAEVPNSEGRLRAHVFGRARIVTRENPRAVAVPNESIHWEGCCHIVFVRIADEIFQTRKVRLGARNGDFTEVHVGVLPGEVVVTTGSHVLKSEVLKSRLGAGCVDD